MVSVNCPTCGSPVSFKAEFSTHAVCGACDALLVRQGAQVDQLGKVAELQPDGSPLRLGSQGVYQGTAFELIGRIQLSFGDGYWNEWHVLFSNGHTGWLGEAMGEYFINSLAKTSGGLPSPHDLDLGDGLSLAGEAFVVTGTVTSTLVSYEGEIPFVVDAQTPFLTADLRSPSGKAATIDYSESPPLLFLGEYVPFASFAFQGLTESDRDPAENLPTTGVAAAGVDKFSCPSCGAPHKVSGGVRSKVLVCEYCGAAVDVGDPNLTVIWKEETTREEIRKGVSLPLGAKTTLDGQSYRLIGFLKKSVTYEGISYPWVEYLLYNRFTGYRWIVESDGHFTLMEPMAALPTRNGNPVGHPSEHAIDYEGSTYRHFQTSRPRIDGLAGEFYWRVRKDEEARNFDYVCPPQMLSLEVAETGYVWSKGRYVTQDEIQQLFSLEKRLRPAVGVAPCEPNPHNETTGTMWKVFLVAFFAGLFLLSSGLLAGGGKQIFKTGPKFYETNRAFPPKESERFSLGRGGNVAFDFEGRVNNRWMFFDATLINLETQKETKVGATVENYAGEGSVRKTVRVSGIPSGDYKLRWNISSGTTTATPDVVSAAKSEQIGYDISLRRGVPVWGWFFLMVIVLLPWPLFEMARRAGFETRRWYNSDHG